MQNWSTTTYCEINFLIQDGTSGSKEQVLEMPLLDKSYLSHFSLSICSLLVLSAEYMKRTSILLQLSGWLCRQRQHLLYPWAAWGPKCQLESLWRGGWHPEENVQLHWADAWVCFSPPDELWWKEKVRGGENESVCEVNLLQGIWKKKNCSTEIASKASCDSIVIPNKAHQKNNPLS